MNRRICFLGTPEISAVLLEGLVKNNFDVTMAVTKEDKIKGRGKKIEESPVAKKARELNIPCYKPHRINKDHDYLKDCDLLLTFAYGQILSEEVLSYSKYPALNVHASILPEYRGAAPMQRVLMDGRKKTGVTLMGMVKGVDAGPVYAMREIDILPEDNYTTLSDKVAEEAVKLCVENLDKFFDGNLVGIPQDDEKMTIAKMISKEEEHLSLESEPLSFVNTVRGLSYKPGPYLLMKEEPLKILKAEVLDDKVLSQSGTVTIQNKKIILQLSKGRVLLRELQRPGKKILSDKDFINGFSMDGVVLR